jgi:hypothetical protein
MMQTTQYRARLDPVADWKVMPMVASRNLGLDRLRNPRSEGGMWTSTIVMGNELFQNEAKVPFVYWHEVVQALPANCPYQAFAVGIRFWGLDRRSQCAYSEIIQCRVKRRRKNQIAIVNDETVRM